MSWVWQAGSDLYRDGGFIMVGLFVLSALLYVTAFRSWLLVAFASKGFRKLSEDPVHGMASETRWGAAMALLESSRSDAQEAAMVFSRMRSMVTRTVNSDLLRVKSLAAAAPLLGLLGTIVGMIETFDAISGSAGSQTSSVVAGGISKALITTNAGLMVALPAFYLAHLIRRKQRQAIQVVDTLETAYLGREDFRND